MHITIDGMTKLFSEWLQEIGVSRQAVYAAERKGINAEDFIRMRLDRYGH